MGLCTHLLCTSRLLLCLTASSVPQHAAWSLAQSRPSCCVASACASVVTRVLCVGTYADALMMLMVLREEPVSAELDVRREAAHNLALLYRSSGADELARQVLRQHFSV